MVSGSISLFLSKCFSPFPHGTGSLSVSREYLAIPDGPGRFAQNYTCSALLRIPLWGLYLRAGDYHPLWSLFPKCHARHHRSNSAVLQPQKCRNIFGLGSSPVARHYWGNHSYFLFLKVLRCFSSLGSPPYLGMDTCPSGRWVVPFGNPRVTGYLHLTAAYRSLSRPSSPP